MKSYNNIVQIFSLRNDVQMYTDENDVEWYSLDDVMKVMPVNMDWYKHLFTVKSVMIGNDEVRFITKAAMMILLQNTDTLYGDYLKLLAEYDHIRVKLDEIERKLLGE